MMQEVAMLAGYPSLAKVRATRSKRARLWQKVVMVVVVGGGGVLVAVQ